MEEGADIAANARRIHEDEGPLAMWEARAKAAWSLALAAVQIQQFLLAHDPELLAEERINIPEDPLRCGVHLLDGVIGAESGPSERI
jgi:hypothetical protein